jgi:hypothetical protein
MAERHPPYPPLTKGGRTPADACRCSPPSLRGGRGGCRWLGGNHSAFPLRIPACPERAAHISPGQRPGPQRERSRKPCKGGPRPPRQSHRERSPQATSHSRQALSHSSAQSNPGRWHFRTPVAHPPSVPPQESVAHPKNASPFDVLRLARVRDTWRAAPGTPLPSRERADTSPDAIGTSAG